MKDSNINGGYERYDASYTHEESISGRGVRITEDVISNGRPQSKF